MSENVEVSEVFPRSRLLEVVPGHGSLSGKDISSNHQPVRWHPLLLASFEFCGMTMEHQTIQQDSSWEYVGGAYVFPHNLVRGLAFLHEKFQPKVYPINMGQWTGNLVLPNLLNIVLNDVSGKN